MEDHIKAVRGIIAAGGRIKKGPSPPFGGERSTGCKGFSPPGHTASDGAPVRSARVGYQSRGSLLGGISKTFGEAPNGSGMFPGYFSQAFEPLRAGVIIRGFRRASVVAMSSVRSVGRLRHAG